MALANDGQSPSSPVTRTIAQSLMYQGFGRFLLAKKKLSQQKSRCITQSYASANLVIYDEHYYV